MIIQEIFTDFAVSPVNQRIPRLFLQLPLGISSIQLFYRRKL